MTKFIKCFYIGSSKINCNFPSGEIYKVTGDRANKLDGHDEFATDLYLLLENTQENEKILKQKVDFTWFAFKDFILAVLENAYVEDPGEMTLMDKPLNTPLTDDRYIIFTKEKNFDVDEVMKIYKEHGHEALWDVMIAVRAICKPLRVVDGGVLCRVVRFSDDPDYQWNTTISYETLGVHMLYQDSVKISNDPKFISMYKEQIKFILEG